MNTAPLAGHTAGPFSLEFQLNDGSGTNDGNNTASLSNFLFNGGAAVGSPTLNGGASGNLTSGVTLTDNSFFNQFIQGFTAGSTLSFRLSLSTNVGSGGTPDQFSFAILDKTGTEIPHPSALVLRCVRPDRHQFRGSNSACLWNGYKPLTRGRRRPNQYRGSDSHTGKLSSAGTRDDDANPFRADCALWVEAPLQRSGEVKIKWRPWGPVAVESTRNRGTSIHRRV
jgi:hypothetical protein